jgi:flavorubredoxin
MTELSTRVDEVADGIYRISTALPPEFLPGGFSFNQYLIVAAEPLLWHTGPRKLFAGIRAAVARVIDPARLGWVGLSHFEADECGSLNEWLALAPRAQPVCGRVAALVSVEDFADRAPRALADGEVLDLGGKRLRWLDAPHLPHAWECGHAFEESTSTLLCGDLLTQPGVGLPAVTRADILAPSEAFRGEMDYWAHGRDTRPLLEKIAATNPKTLACMHGSAWEGDGAAMLRALADAVEAKR